MARPLQSWTTPVSRTALHRLLQPSCPLRAVQLYLFYLYVEQWREDLRLQLSKRFTAQYLGIGPMTLLRAHHHLKRLGLIRDGILRTPDHEMRGCYVDILRPPAPLGHKPIKNSPLKPPSRGNGTLPTYPTGSSRVPRSAVRGNNKKEDIKPIDRHFDHHCAHKFLEGVRQKYRYHSRTDLKQWTAAFRQLREEDHIPPLLIGQVVEWYTRHVKDKYTPQVYRAKDLREKFPRLIEARATQLHESGEAEREDPYCTTQTVRLANGAFRTTFHYQDQEDSPHES